MPDCLLVPLLALIFTLSAAGTCSVLLQPLLSQSGLTGVQRALPLVCFALLLVPPGLLSGDWLWASGKRRQGPPRGQMMGRLTFLSSALALVIPLALTDRPLAEIALGVSRLMEPSSFPGAPLSAPPPSQPTPSPVAAPPLNPTTTPPIRRWSRAQAEEAVAKEGQPGLPATVPGERPFGEVVQELPLQVEGTRLTAPQPAEPLPPGTFLVYEWVDRLGESHWSDDFHEIPNDGKVLKATVMKPPPPESAHPLAPQARTQPPPGRPLNPFDNPMLPSPAESYWRNKFSRVYEETRLREKKIAAKERELIDAPANFNRDLLQAQLRALKGELAEDQGRLQDLEREASWRAVPREWRH